MTVRRQAEILRPSGKGKAASSRSTKKASRRRNAPNRLSSNRFMSRSIGN